MKPMSQPWPLWVGLLAFIAMLAAVYGLLSQSKARQPLAQLQSTLTATFAASATPAPSQTPQPQATATWVSKIVTATPPYPSILETAIPTSIPLPISTPQAVAQSYRLKPWTEQDALQALEEAQNSEFNLEQQEGNQVLSTPSLTSTPVETYSSSDEAFYEESLLYEAFLRYPQLRSDPGLNNELLNFKDNSQGSIRYGLVHDQATEPIRSQLENALNQGQVEPNSDSLKIWLYQREINLQQMDTPVNLFGDKSPAQLVQLDSNNVEAFFIIRRLQSGSYQVFSLNSQWMYPWWDQLSYQLHDLNGNGRPEIAIIDNFYGSGGSTDHCDMSMQDFEWNGSEFQDLMENGQVEFVYYGDCLDLTFQPGLNGTQTISAETQKPTHCEDIYYTERTLFYWDGKGFKAGPPQALPPTNSQLNKCAISWAEVAGPHVHWAVQILESALKNWPDDAIAEWGPASRDYFGLKLATWYLRQPGQVDKGLALLRSIANAPHTPNYPIPAEVAKLFLKTYASDGIVGAVQAVSDYYNNQLKSISACGEVGCDAEKIMTYWGFAEQEWQSDGRFANHFINDFDALNSLTLGLQADQPKDFDAFKSWLIRNRIDYSNLQQADLDGDGTPDWLVTITFNQQGYNGYSYSDIELYGIMHSPTGLYPLIIYDNNDSLVFGSNFGNNYDKTGRWQSFRPSANADLVNVYQAGNFLLSFRIHQLNGEYRALVDMPTDALMRSDQLPPVTGWSINDTPQGQDLVVQYYGVTGIYGWDSNRAKLVPTGFSPDLQEQNISQIEQSIYVDHDPAKALVTLNGMLGQKIFENFDYDIAPADPQPPFLRPYLLYLRGLAYELTGDNQDAVSNYWQLWHDYPADPFALIAQRKLEPNK